MRSDEFPPPAGVDPWVGEPPPIISAQSSSPDARMAVDEVAQVLDGADLALVVFFCSSRYDLDALAAALDDRFAGTPVVGCTTAGEFGPGGYQDGSFVALGLTSQHFSAAVAHIDDLDSFDEDVARAGAADMLASTGGSAEHSFALLLIDGLSVREERIARQCQRALGDIPLVGGSAGDDQQFVATHVFHDGRFRNGAVWIVVTTPFAFTVFRSTHFVGASDPLVVTEADASTRTVHEINGFPAAVEYARVLGRTRDELDARVLAAAPLVVRIGGTDYVRSIQKINDDHSLRLYCAMERGVVLRVASSLDLVETRRDLFEDMRRKIGAPLAVVGFDCIQCKVEAENLDGRQSIEQLFRDNQVVGFSSYGEQFVGSHVNQTFSGVAIGGSPR